MSTTAVTVHSLPEILEQNEVVLLDFWAAWCLPCTQFSPVFAEVSEQFPDAFFGTVNTDEQQELAAIFGILSLPTLIVFRDKQIVFRQAGVPNAEQLADIVAQVQTLDMGELAARLS